MDLLTSIDKGLDMGIEEFRATMLFLGVMLTIGLVELLDTLVNRLKDKPKSDDEGHPNDIGDKG